MHQLESGNNLTTEMSTRAVQCIDGDGGTRINQANCGFRLAVCTDHGRPTVDAETSRLHIGIAYTESLAVGARKTHVDPTMDPDEARQPCTKRRTGNIAGKHGVNIARQSSIQCCHSGFFKHLMPDTAGSANTAVRQHSPLQTRVPNVEQQCCKFHRYVPSSARRTVPERTRTSPASVRTLKEPSAATPSAKPVIRSSPRSTISSLPRSQS